MRAVIIDDTEKAISALKSDLDQFCPDVILAGEASGVESGLELIRKVSPDLIFLDIRMNDGTGFELIEKLKKENATYIPVIFTTAYNEYAIKAFKFSAVDYLLKPIDPEDLIQAVKKAEKQKTGSNSLSLELLLNSLKNPAQTTATKRIALSSQDKIHLISVQEIIRCESHSNYTLFFLTGGRQILVTKTLKDYDELLTDFGFARIHHSHLINLEHLREFVKGESYVLMSDQSSVPVSVRKRDSLLKQLGL